MLCKRKNVDFVTKRQFLELKHYKMGHKKELKEPELQTVYEMDFCFLS
jgi:hypothetical protein